MRGAAAVVCPRPGIRPGIKSVLISGEDGGEAGRPLCAVLGALGAVTGSLISGAGTPAVPGRQAGTWSPAEREGAENQSGQNLGFGVSKVSASEERASSLLCTVEGAPRPGLLCSRSSQPPG